VKLVGGNAFLAGHDQVHRLKHLMKRHARMFEHGANLHCGLLAALAALLEAVANRAFGALRGGLTANAGQVVHAGADHAGMRQMTPFAHTISSRTERLPVRCEIGAERESDIGLLLCRYLHAPRLGL
jgi:hypothetical protein